MKTYPSIALIEFSSIATGLLASNEMLKKAPISVIKSGTVHNGKFIVLIGGSVASVQESFGTGLELGEVSIIDSVILSDVHEQLHNGILGKRQNCNEESLGIMESSSVSTMIKATDSGVKGANVKIIEIRLADDIGGKSFTIYNGSIEEVQAAIEIAKKSVTSPDHWINEILIPNIHPDMITQINQTTIFSKANLEKLDGSEIE